MTVRAYGKSVESYDAWEGATEYSLEDYCVPTTDNGLCYECTTAGTSDSSEVPVEPTWPIGVGETVEDGTVVWTCREKAEAPNALSLILGEAGDGLPNVDIWVKSDESATFYIYGSYNGTDLRLLDTLSVPVGELTSNHKSFTTGYAYIAVGTSTSATNEIEIVRGE